MDLKNVARLLIELETALHQVQIRQDSEKLHELLHDEYRRGRTTCESVYAGGGAVTGFQNYSPSHCGAVYFNKFSGGKWSDFQELVLKNPEISDYFGVLLSIIYNEKIIVFGAPSIKRKRGRC